MIRLTCSSLRPCLVSKRRQARSSRKSSSSESERESSSAPDTNSLRVIKQPNTHEPATYPCPTRGNAWWRCSQSRCFAVCSQGSRRLRSFAQTRCTESCERDPGDSSSSPSSMLSAHQDSSPSPRCWIRPPNAPAAKGETPIDPWWSLKRSKSCTSERLESRLRGIEPHKQQKQG